MIVISYGLEKSGSTLAFEMAKIVLELNGHEQPRLEDGLVNEGSEINEVGAWPEERLVELVRRTEGTAIVIRTHHPPAPAAPTLFCDLLRTGEVKIHVTFRDPRDIVVSMVDDGVRARLVKEKRHRGIRTIDDALPLLGGRLETLRRWASLPSLKLRYEEFAVDPELGPRLIADDLGMTVRATDVWRELEARHTRKNVGRSQRYMTEMWPEEIARIERAFPLYLDFVRGVNEASWLGTEPCSS